MSGYTSDQLVAHATGDGQLVPTTQRARITGIQAEGAASSSVIFKSGGAAGTVIATFRFNCNTWCYYNIYVGLNCGYNYLYSHCSKWHNTIWNR
jgi:hypothetical protein